MISRMHGLFPLKLQRCFSPYCPLPDTRLDLMQGSMSENVSIVQQQIVNGGKQR
jgi:hypothetical protein